LTRQKVEYNKSIKTRTQTNSVSYHLQPQSHSGGVKRKELCCFIVKKCEQWKKWE